METTIANQISAQFPGLKVAEDIISNECYWVNVRVGNQWLVIQKNAQDEIGISVVQDESLDFGGHDYVVRTIDEAVAFSIRRIKELSAK